jgi:putative flippase GtrA
MRREKSPLWQSYGGDDLAAKMAKFALVGGTGVAVNTVALYLLYQVGHVPLIVASILAVELAIVNNFLWNNRWTFGQRDLSPGRFLRFNIVSLGGLAITTGTLYLVSSLGVYYLLANLLGITLATVWNFALNVLWTWRWQS